MQTAIQTDARLQAENDQLRAELAAMKSPEVKAAIDAIQHPAYPNHYSDAHLLASICRGWLASHKQSHALCAAAKKVDHAGLEYLAVEADWATILGLGRCEAIAFVEAMLAESDELLIGGVLKEYPV